MVNLVAADTGALAVVSDFPREVDVVSHVAIPLSDGHTLSARVWLPRDAETDPVPAIVEYAPFRHRDFTAPRDAMIHPWFAGHGYAAIRVELRGSGDSTGQAMDEYVLQEQLDALDALEWIASQPWCNGHTSMIGMSWGGFSALQVAAHQPPSLSAIIAVHATDDRFADDVHYMGGIPLYNNLSWGALSWAYFARPPDPFVSGEGWREIWRDRIETAPFVLKPWTEHQRRDAYWRHASVAEDYSRIQCPVYVVCGWADGYTDAAVRLAEGLTVPRKVVIGPWAHTYPHLARPGPQFDFLGDAVAWLDQWCRPGRGTQPDPTPDIWLYVQDSAPPASEYAWRGGYWIRGAQWPDVRAGQWHLGDGTLTLEQPGSAELTLRSPRATGATGGEWLSHGVGPEMPLDLRHDAGGMLAFTSAPLASPLALCGAPEVTLHLKVEPAPGQLVLHLADVHPDGKVARITYGARNLFLATGSEGASGIVAGEWTTLTVKLGNVAQSIPAGHRLQLLVATEYWPLFWPSHQRMTAHIATAGSRLTLPLLETTSERLVLPEPRIPATDAITVERPVSRARSVAHDLVANRLHRRYERDDGTFVVNEHGMRVTTWFAQDYWIQAEDEHPADNLAGGTIRARIELSREGWHTTVECEVTQHMTADGWALDGELRATEGDRDFATRRERHNVKRDGVQGRTE